MKISRKTVSCLVTLVLISLLALTFFAGCTQETYSEPDNPPVTGKTQEEQEREAEEERRRLEEEQRLAGERQREERRLREEALKAELGPFYVPLPPEVQEDNPPVKAKGIYVTGHSAGIPARFNDLMELVTSTELNAMVIDVKNDYGLVTYPSQIEIVRQVGADRAVPIKDITAVLTALKERDIYPIARLVVFRDPHLAEQRNDWAIQRKDGGVFRDYKRFAWVNPYHKNVWDYNIAIAKEVALLGFREIQFDYVRFPENAAAVDRVAYFPHSGGREKDEAIAGFIAYAREQLKEYNVHISADVFGVIATSWGDSDRIGQTWEKVSPLVDIICPMIYPSHYGPGYFGFPVPDANPGGTVKRALTDAIKRNAPLENPAVIRPWLQSFTATWVPGYIPYGAKEVRQQIDAALELGIDEFLIWNAGNRYIRSAFLQADEAAERERKAVAARNENGRDALGKTAAGALEEYLDAVRRKNWRDILVLQSGGTTVDYNGFREWVSSWAAALSSYRITGKDVSESSVIFEADLTFAANGEKTEIAGEKFEVLSENSIWRVRPPQRFTRILTSGRE